MANDRPNTPTGLTSTGTKDPGEAAPLSKEEQDAIRARDEADQKVIKETTATSSGKRIRAIPAVITRSGDTGSQVEVRKVDFANHDVDHDSVVFTFNKNNFTLQVGKEISKEAADLLVKIQPQSFEYVNDGVSEE